MLGARASASRFPACQTGKPGQTFELAQTVWHPTTYCRRTREFSICYCTSGTVLSVDASPNWQRMNERPTVVGVWLSLSLSLSLSFCVSSLAILLPPRPEPGGLEVQRCICTTLRRFRPRCLLSLAGNRRRRSCIAPLRWWPDFLTNTETSGNNSGHRRDLARSNLFARE